MKLINTKEKFNINGRDFTRIIGGFGKDKAVTTVRQVSELLGYDDRTVNQTISRNIKHFEENLHIIDIKNSITSCDSVKEVLESLGYSKQSISNSKNIYILSEAGFLLYLKFADGENSISLYKDFIEKYFRTVAQKNMLEKSYEELIIDLEEKRAMLLGKMFMTGDTALKMDYFNQSEELNRVIQEHKDKITSVKALDNVKTELALADSFTQSNNTWDVGVFSKVLSIKNLGRNNMFKYFKEKGFTMDNNTPYQRYSKYFKIVPVLNKYNGMINNKLVIKPEGIKFLFETFVKDGMVISKTYEEVKEELTK